MGIGVHDYVHLHNHTEYSVLDGYGRIDEYVQTVAELGQPALGITDHGNIAGVKTFLEACANAGITGLPGCELYMAPQHPDGARHKQPVFYGTPAQRRHDVGTSGKALHLTVHAYTQTGLVNLSILNSLSYHADHAYGHNRVDDTMLAEHHDGLIVLSGCPGSEISVRFRLGQHDQAYAYADRLLQIFGRDRFFVELMEHNMASSLERDLTRHLVELAKRMNLRMVATNDCHYTRPEHAARHEELLCAQTNAKMSWPTDTEDDALIEYTPTQTGHDGQLFSTGGPSRQTGGAGKRRGKQDTRFSFAGTGEYYLKTAAQMAALFPPDDFPGALSNTLVIAEMAQGNNLHIPFDPDLRAQTRIPDGYPSVEAYFDALITAGIARRYPNADQALRERITERLDYELDRLKGDGFLQPVLVVRSFTEYVRQQHTMVGPDGTPVYVKLGPGRGSAAGSLTLYLLGITDVDPLRFGLDFDRFLGPGRARTYRIEHTGGVDEGASADKYLRKDGTVVYRHDLKPGDWVKPLPPDHPEAV